MGASQQGSSEGVHRGDARCRGSQQTAHKSHKFRLAMGARCRQRSAASAGDGYLISGWARAAVSACCATHTNCLCVGEIRRRHCATPTPRRSPSARTAAARQRHAVPLVRCCGQLEGTGAACITSAAAGPPCRWHVASPVHGGIGWSGRGRAPAGLHAGAPFCETAQRSEPKPSVPPYWVFCYFYQ